MKGNMAFLFKNRVIIMKLSLLLCLCLAITKQMNAFTSPRSITCFRKICIQSDNSSSISSKPPSSVVSKDNIFDKSSSCLLSSISDLKIQTQTVKHRYRALSSNFQPVSMSMSGFSEDGTTVPVPDDDVHIRNASLALRRISWFSWWGQVILTTVSSITLLFARSVLAANGRGPNTASGIAGGFLFAGSGIGLSVLSIIWTWGAARLSRRLLRSVDYSHVKVANMIRRTITVGTYLNLLGMLVTLIGAEQIVGLLAAKVLTMQGVSPFGTIGTSLPVSGSQTLQPLDILVVQANTNTLMSHFLSLVGCLYLTRSVHKLDPPSADSE
jgi:hypothetical protein